MQLSRGTITAAFFTRRRSALFDSAEGLEFRVEALGDGHAAAEAEGAAGDFEAGGHLLAFVFGEVDEAGDAFDGGGVEARAAMISATLFSSSTYRSMISSRIS